MQRVCRFDAANSARDVSLLALSRGSGLLIGADNRRITGERYFAINNDRFFVDDDTSR